ncbi:hypothetical protein OMO38_02620 [Chryseobacterium sp. 09-1422]|uniref:Uncharacterized protein n=1 Tax=Chryseobacterium kimseyorum TaxID=2984028 RepID=A0ABT3HUE8_9FLAO|nr:hypothetical protein [Chryseobacterium kimseyorum]MCW3167412.1 hypothetical protein [Chryseobacterium kimseyorum]
MKTKKEFQARINAKALLNEKLSIKTSKSSGMDLEYKGDEGNDEQIFLGATLTGNVIKGKIYANANKISYTLKATPTNIGISGDIKGKMVLINCSCKGDPSTPCILTVIIQDRVYHASSQTDSDGIIDFVAIIHFI